MLINLFDSWLADGAGTLDDPLARMLAAGLVSLGATLAIGPWAIRWLRGRFREPIKSASAAVAQLHSAKANTPTMGGLLILAALIGSTVLWTDLSNPYPLIAILLIVSLGALGACDDLVKLSTSARGLSARSKFLGQTAIALVIAVLVYRLQAGVEGGLERSLPLVGWRYDLGWWFIPLATLVLVGTSNAVNLTDGLDGLAGGCLLPATAALAVLISWDMSAPGNVHWLPASVAHRGEMLVVAGAMLGSLLGFLWFNAHPAQLFMGDTGSLPLGGLLGLLAIVARQELLLLIVGGLFVAEAGSVIVQVGWFRWRKRRVFLCAPLHHHFQLKGWPETKIVVRFWIAAAACAVLGLTAVHRGWNGTPQVPEVSSVQQVTR